MDHNQELSYVVTTILGYFTNKPLRLDPRFLGRFSGFIGVAAKSSAQKFFLVAAIYEHLVGGLVKTLYMYIYIYILHVLYSRSILCKALFWNLSPREHKDPRTSQPVSEFCLHVICGALSSTDLGANTCTYSI